MKKILSFLCVTALTIFALISCGNGSKTMLPNVSGKAGEVVIVMDREYWEGDAGIAVREVLGGDCPYLATKEPLYNLVNVSTTGFSDLFKVHRNIVIFTVDPQAENEGVQYKSDVWAQPQCVIQVTSFQGDSLLAVFRNNQERILAAIEQAERDRIINNSKLYEDYDVSKVVKPLAGGSPHFPTGYKVKKVTDDFIWIADEKQYTNQGIFVYRYPAQESENFTLENIISNRNRILKENVPGMFENTYMTTSTYFAPTVEFIRFRGRQFAQTRGFWEVEGDFMGGPFISHSFYSKDNKYIITLDGWVYAPKYDKRHYLRQVEAIIYSFEWEGKKSWDDNAQKSSEKK